MDKSDQRMMGILFVFMLLMMLSQYIPKPWDTVVVYGAYFAMLGFMVLSDLVLQYTLSKYLALDMVIIPLYRRETLLVSDVQTVSRQGDRYLTKLVLYNSYHDPEGGKTRVIYIHHLEEFTRRFGFKPSRIRYSGRVVDHPQVEFVMAIRNPRAHVDHAKLYPVFIVVSTSKDADIFYRTYLNNLSKYARTVSDKL